MVIEQILGAALTLLFLADIFLTVLYARAGTGLLALRWNRAVWALLRRIASLSGRRQGAMLSFAGRLAVQLRPSRRATLIETALDQRRYGAVAASAALASIRRGGRLLLETLDANFPTAGNPPRQAEAKHAGSRTVPGFPAPARGFTMACWYPVVRDRSAWDTYTTKNRRNPPFPAS